MFTTEGTAHRFVLISGHSKTVLSMEKCKPERAETGYASALFDYRV
jgi:hypothetical protein